MRTIIFLTWLLAVATYLPMASADLVRLMKTGDVATMQIHQDLTQATKQIDIMTYIFDPCSLIGKMILEDLRARARAGVKVRLLLDAYLQDSDLRRNLSAELASEKIELRYFNVRAELDPMSNRRMHAKIMVIDGKKYYVGGRNVADDYFDMEANNWVDRDIEVEGTSARMAQANFNTLWNSDMTTSENFGATAGFQVWRSQCLTPNAANARLTQAITQSSATILASQKTFTCKTVRPVVDDPHFLDVEGAPYILGEQMDAAQYRHKYTTRAAVDFIAHAKNLTIENYTYVPEGKIQAALDKLRARGVHVDIFTNLNMDENPLQYLKELSVTKDHSASEWIYEISNKGSGSFPWATTPAGAHWMIHAKAMSSGTASGRAQNAFVGSFNLDPRSYGTNVEAAVTVADCPAFAQDLQDYTNTLYEVYERDLSCKACQQKIIVSPADQLEGVLGRQLFSVKPK